jgi:hypothetical protein
MREVTESLKNVVVGDFEYFKSWYEFNFNVEKHLSDRALESVFSVYRKDIFPIISQSDSTGTIVRRNMLAMLGLGTSLDYDITAKSVKLAITAKNSLERAMVISGAIFYHREIVKVISKKELNILTEFIGQDIYSFIVKRGMMLWKMVPELRVEAKGSITEKITTAGKDILCKALFGLPDEIKKRLELIFEQPFAIPSKCDELLVKKCFELVNFSLEKSSTKN